MFRKWFALFFRIVPTKCILSCNKVITRFTPFCSQFLSRLTLFCIKILTRCIIPYNIVLTRCILFTISSDKIFPLYNKFWQDLLSFEVNFYQDLLSFYIIDPNKCILSSNKTSNEICFLLPHVQKMICSLFQNSSNKMHSFLQ